MDVVATVGTGRHFNPGNRDTAAGQQVEVDARDDVQDAFGARFHTDPAAGAGCGVQDEVRAARPRSQAKSLGWTGPGADTAGGASLRCVKYSQG